MSGADIHRAIEAVWRIEAARVIAGLARIVRDLDLAEDLVSNHEGSGSSPFRCCAAGHAGFPDHREKPPAFDDSIDIVAWFARWLRKWSLNAFPDEAIRDAALEMARQKQRGS